MARTYISLAVAIATLNIPKSTVYRVLNHGRTERKPRGSPKNKKLTEKFVQKTKKAVEANPTLSIRAHAKKLKVSERTVRRGLKQLGKRSLVRPQQDGAPAHTSKKTQDWLATNLAHLWDKSLRPPTSPDLNPLDYSVRGILECEACKNSHSSVDDLKTSIVKAWRALSKDYLVHMCRQFRTRLERVIDLEDGSLKKNLMYTRYETSFVL